MRASSGERSVIKFGLLLVTMALLAGALLAVTAMAVAQGANAIVEDTSDPAPGGLAEGRPADHARTDEAALRDDAAEGLNTAEAVGGQMQRMEVMPSEVHLEPGEQQQFTATGYDDRGAEVTITPTWSADGGTIGEAGLYTATDEGDWTVTALQGDVQGTATVHVREPVLDSIEVTPSSTYLGEGQQQVFIARGFNEEGHEMTITPIWSASGGSVDQNGVYTAGSLPGSYAITAEASVGAVTRQGQGRAQILGLLPPDLAAGQSYCHRFPYAGPYPYYDGWNPGLKGTVVVTTADLALLLPDYEVGEHPAVTASLSIAADGFTPPSVTVGTGDTVCWTNTDVVTHAIRGGTYYQRVYMPLMLGEYPPPLPPREWDVRLDELGVTVEDAQVGPGEAHWRLVAAQWANEQESGGLHHIFFDVLDEGEERVVGQPVVVEWSTGSVTLYIEDKPPSEPGANFGMDGTLGSYDAYVGGEQASDRVVGMGMGTPEQPAHTIHTSFFLTFQWVP